MNIIEKIKTFVLLFKKQKNEINKEMNSSNEKIRTIERFIQKLNKLESDINTIYDLLSIHVDLLLESDIRHAWLDTLNMCKHGYNVSEDGNAFLTYKLTEKEYNQKQYISGIYYEIKNMITESKTNLEFCKDYFDKKEYNIVEKQFDIFLKDVKYRTEYSRIDFCKICVDCGKSK